MKTKQQIIDDGREAERLLSDTYFYLKKVKLLQRKKKHQKKKKKLEAIELL